MSTPEDRWTLQYCPPLLHYLARCLVVSRLRPASLAALLAVLGGTLEVIGPICILVGFYRRQAALLFIFRCCSYSAAVHIPLLFIFRCYSYSSDRHRGVVPQFLELSVQRRPWNEKLL